MGKQQDVLQARLEAIEAQIVEELGQSTSAVVSLRAELAELRAEWAMQLEAEVTRQLSALLPKLLRQALQESNGVFPAICESDRAISGVATQESPSSLAELAATSGSTVEELVRLFRSPADLRELMDECGVTGKLRRRRIAIQHASLTRWDSVEAHALARFTVASSEYQFILPRLKEVRSCLYQRGCIYALMLWQRSTTTSPKGACCLQRPRTRAGGQRSVLVAPCFRGPMARAISR